MVCVCILASILQTCVPQYDVCVERNSSKQCQLGYQSFAEAPCQLKYYLDDNPTRGTFDCTDAVIGSYPGVSLGTVNLEAFVHTCHGYTWPGINISFHNAEWTDLWLSIKSKQDISKNMCHKFLLKEKVSNCQQFYLDGPWYAPGLDYKGQDFNMEYVAYNKANQLRENGKFLLHVPVYSEDANVTNITNWELFVYLDITRAPKLTVLWMAAPHWLGGVAYNVHKYNVTLHYRKTENSSDEVQMLDIVEANEELQILYDMGSTPGTYRFGVQIVDPACGSAGCQVSFTPDINNKGHTGFFLAVIISCSVLIPLVLCISYVFMKWLERTKKHLDMKQSPVVLIVYVPTHRAHVRAVKALANYLHSFCRVEILLHDNGVPQDVVDLQSWFSKAYENANFVMVISSPLQHTALRETIYVNAGEIGLKLLRLKFASSSIPPENLFCAVLPYCTKEDLPKEAIHFRKFFLIQDLDEMLKYLWGEWGGMRGKVLTLLGLQVPGGLAHYKEHGRELDVAIDEATTKIQSDVGVFPVAVTSSNHTESYFSGSIPLVHSDTENLLDRFLKVERPVKPRSPFFPDNVQAVQQGSSSQPPKKHTPKRVIDSSFKL